MHKHCVVLGLKHRDDNHAWRQQNIVVSVPFTVTTLATELKPNLILTLTLTETVTLTQTSFHIHILQIVCCILQLSHFARATSIRLQTNQVLHIQCDTLTFGGPSRLSLVILHIQNHSYFFESLSRIKCQN